MRLVIGSDHAGYFLKQELGTYLRQLEYPLLDVGTHSTDPVDYPDFAEAVAMAILQGQAERGILICGSGIGASVAVNKLPGLRAGICHDTYSAHQGVEHDDMNVLVLGGRVVGPAVAREVLDAFLRAKFTAEDRHLRRLEKIRALEARYLAGLEAAPGPNLER